MDFFQFGVTTGEMLNGHQFTYRQPFITGKRAAIAKAAYDAGFDCSDPSKLLHLIDAVVMANNKFLYPDRWDGPAAFQSTIYPDTWTAAHIERKGKKTYSVPYDHEARGPAVPAFVIPAAEIVRNLSHKPKRGNKAYPRTSTSFLPSNVSATGANAHPLRERTMNKRMATVQLLRNQDFKRPKLEQSSQAAVVDITQDENAAPSLPHQSNVSRPVSVDKKRGNHAPNAARSAAVAIQADAIAAGTGDLLRSIVTRLNTGVETINSDREALRNRWEADKRLQLLTITDHLKILNECFARAEEGLRGSLEVIKRFIL
ncbi:MAG: hypothetical protein Q9170_000303 [Blastenia crenularia]